MAELSKEWIQRVSLAFNTSPRDGTRKSTVWLDRGTASKEFNEAIWRLGAHLCVDGPSGAGKTSLVTTELSKRKMSHVAVQLTKKMDWPEFCRQLVSPYAFESTGVSGVIEGGISRGLPSFKIKAGLKSGSDPLSQAQLTENLAKNWTEHDVAGELQKRAVVLFLDDVERADRSLISRLSDLSKLLIHSDVPVESKIIFVGSGDIFRRLYDANPSLDERLLQISLGAFKRWSASAFFIAKGLQSIGLRHPWNSSINSERRRSKDCTVAVWEAADGLPKSVNYLGLQIAARGQGRKGITAHDVLEESENMCQRHWIESRDRFENVLVFLTESPAARKIIGVLYSKGIGAIHSIENILSACGGYSRSKVNEVLQEFAALDFLVHTGKSGEIIFAKHPGAAHTLGVAMRHPERFSSDLSLEREEVSKAFPVPCQDDGLLEEEKDRAILDENNRHASVNEVEKEVENDGQQELNMPE